MRVIYLLNLSGLQYAVWKDEVESVLKVETIHRLPFSPACVAGLASIDKHSVALADLAALIGLPPFDRNSQGQLLLVAGQKKDAGFIVAGDVVEISIPAESVQPMPGYVVTPEIFTCIIYQEKPVPVIDLQALYRHINSKDLNPSVPTLPVPGNDSEPSVITAIKQFSVGGEDFALPANLVGSTFDKPGDITAIPLTPESLQGIIFAGNSIMPVIDLAEKMNIPDRRDEKQLLTLAIDGQDYGFLVDRTSRTFSGNNFSFKPLPPLAKSSLVTTAAINKQEIIPIVDPLALIDVAPSQLDELSLADLYQSASDFSSRFNHEEVEVVEFMLLGERHALPKNEVEDILPIAPFRRIPGLQSLVIGIIEYQGDILPVLDLALVFARRSPITSDWCMILVNNGDFRAFVVTEGTHSERVLPLNIQKKVPISLPNNLVYGCYPDGNIVRLIVNVMALAVHFDKTVVKNFLSSLTKEMAEIAAEVVPDLLPDEQVVLLEKEASQEENEGQQRGDDILQPDVYEEGPEPDIESVSKGGDGQPESGLEESPSIIDNEEELSRCLTDKLAQFDGGEEIVVQQEVESAGDQGIIEEQVRQVELEREILEQEKLAGARAEEEQRQLAALVEKERERTQKILVQKRQDAKDLVKAREERLKQEEELEKQRLAAEDEEARTRMREILARQKQKEILLLRAEESAIRLEEQEQARLEAERLRLEIEEKSKAEAQVLREQIKGQQRLQELAHARAAEEAKQIVVEQQVSGSEDEKARVLAEFRDNSKKNKDDNTRLIVLLSLLLLLLLDVFIFFGIPEKQQLEPLADGHDLLGQTATGNGVKSPVDAVAPTRAPEPVTKQAAPATGDNPEHKETDTGNGPVAKVLVDPAGDHQVKQTKAPGEEPQPLRIIVKENHPSANTSYEVKNGDTLWDISRRLTGTPYNYPLVARENEINNPDLIFPEQHILLKIEDKQE